MLQHLNRISYNIDMLAEHLNYIAESMLIAKLQNFPKFILSEKKFNKIEKNF